MDSPSAYSNGAGGIGPIVSNGNPPVHTPLKSPRRAAIGPTLGAIEEDGGMQPDVPPIPHRNMARRLHLPFGNSTPKEPPPYTWYHDITGPRGEKFADLRNNRHLSKRGGWKRFLLIGVVLLVLILGLAIGLGVGLQHSNSTTRYSSSSSSPPASPSSPPTAPFPAGSYSFDTSLSSVSTSCTPNSNTWRCYPYSTYAESGTGADAIFNWIITPLSENSTSYMISSSNNPFALTFTNATLDLTDAGTSNEAYRFSVSMQKTVIPNVTLTADDSTTECYYNGTLFSATLYTKMAKTYGSNSTGSTEMGTQNYTPWPYAVEVSQDINAGSGVPDCYKTINGEAGAHVDVGTSSNGGTCQCQYLNTGT